MSVNHVHKQTNTPTYPELNSLLKNLCELINLEKLYIIGYIANELFLTNLPPQLSVLKLSNYSDLELLNLPSCIQKIIIENNKNNIFAKKGEYENFIKPVSPDKITVNLNNYIDRKIFYFNNKNNTDRKIIFNVTIQKIPHEFNVFFAKPFELTEKYIGFEQ